MVSRLLNHLLLSLLQFIDKIDISPTQISSCIFTLLPTSGKEASPRITQLTQRHINVLVVFILCKVSNANTNGSRVITTISPPDLTFPRKNTLLKSHMQSLLGNCYTQRNCKFNKQCFLEGYHMK